ncbi:MAG: hypothetical protein K5651_08060 [Bacteroidales bacterium]|nr:hypothetical protein [Bacteroidales bacterium]
MTRNYTFNINKALWALLCAAALCPAFLSCSKEQIVDSDSIANRPAEEGSAPQDPDNPDSPGEDQPEIRPQVTIHVGLEEEGSRINIEKGDAGLLHTAWAAGDKLRVGRDSNAEEKLFTIKDGYSDHTADFTGEALGDGISYYVIYPSNITWNYIYSKDYNGVKQVGNDDTGHIDYCVMLSGMTTFPSSLLLTDRYAEREGLTLCKSSVIKFYLKLPAEATTPTRLEIKAGKVGAAEGSDYIFYANNNEDSRTNALTLYLDSVTPDNQTITAYLSIPWFGYSVAAGQELTISAYYETEGGDHKVVSKTITPGANTYSGGQTILYQVNMTKGSTTALNTDGEGTEDNPYILSTVDDLLAMKGKLLNNETVYFEMDEDIDMASLPNWAPLNNNQQIGFKRYIHFNGNGHLIKNFRCTGEAYASFFGVLCGECCNTGFVDAHVEGVNSCAGIIAAYLGFDTPTKTAETGVIDQCYTSGYVTTNGSSVGGLAGQVGAIYSGTKSTISNSYSSAVVEGNSCGGLTGYLKEGSLIQGSYFCGINASPDAYWMGGIAAKAYSDSYATQPIINQCASLTKTSIAPHSGNNNVVFRIVRPSGMTVTNCKVWNGTNGNLRYSSDTQTNTLSEVQALFTTTLGSANGWSTTLNGNYPLLTWQVDRGDYATYAGHGRDYFDGGDGSESKPFLISEAYQLYNIEEHLNNSDTTYFKLAADVDLSAIDNWSPINKSNSGLLINWDGNNKELSNLSLANTSSYAGLFGVLIGKVSDLTLKDFSVTQSANYSGGILAGFLANTGSAKARLKDITIDGGGVTMIGSSAVGSLGGFCGEIYASGCSSSATVTQRSKGNTDQTYSCGGLVGGTRHATGTAVFEDCSFSGSLDGYDNCGGILGVTVGEAGPRISACSFSGSITARARSASGSVNALSGESAGGIVGYHSRGCITGCSTTATSSVSGAGNNIGGIVGYLNHTTGPYLFSGGNHYGSVTGVSNVGGIIGRFRSTVGSQISDCHAYAATEKSISASDSYCGGIVGHFWSQSAPASGYTFSNCSSSATLSVTTNYAGGIIGYVSEDSTNGHSILSLDDCSSTGSISAGSNSAGGLIGGMRAKKLTMTRCSSDATVSTSDQYAGGLIGYLSGQYMDTPKDATDMSLAGCHFTGSVTAGNNCGGGIAGQAYQWVGTMDDCTTSGSVQARNYAGGIVGQTTSGSNLQLTACSHNTGNVSYDSTYGSYEENVVNGIGGLVGQFGSDGTIERCRVQSCTVTGTHALGGLVGYHASGTLTVSESWFDGTVRAEGTGNTRAAGGILGKSFENSSSYTTVIEDCYSRGTITASGGQVAGGIVGEAMKGIIVSYCISDCSIEIQRCAGGIIGRACNGDWKYNNDGKVKVENCICWSPSVTGTVTNNGSASSGAIIGFTSKLNWMYRCYYNPNMTFSGVNVKNTLVSQNSGKGYNTDYEGSTDAMVPGTTAGTWTTDPYIYVMPYHGGTVASSGRSACTVAQAIGFASRTNASSQAIWELFSGGTYNANFIMPELKQLRESSDSPGAISDLNKNSIFEEGDF